MWETFFLIGAWLTITPPPALLTDTTSVMFLEFNGTVSTGWSNKENYIITDNLGDTIPIYQIQIVDTVFDGAGDIIISESNLPDSSLIALQIKKGVFKRIYTTVVSNLVDNIGRSLNTNYNSDGFYHAGYYPNLITVPTIYIRKE